MKKKKLLGLSLVTLILFTQVSTPTTAIAISSEAAQTIEASKKNSKNNGSNESPKGGAYDFSFCSSRSHFIVGK